MLADEWQMMGWNNVSEMTKFGMPGVFTHGTSLSSAGIPCVSKGSQRTI